MEKVTTLQIQNIQQGAGAFLHDQSLDLMVHLLGPDDMQMRREYSTISKIALLLNRHLCIASPARGCNGSPDVHNDLNLVAIVKCTL